MPAAQTVSEVARLYDASVVSYPAYPQTEVALRSLQEARARRPLVPPRPPLERFAREARWNELAE